MVGNHPSGAANAQRGPGVVMTNFSRRDLFPALAEAVERTAGLPRCPAAATVVCAANGSGDWVRR